MLPGRHAWCICRARNPTPLLQSGLRGRVNDDISNIVRDMVVLMLESNAWEDTSIAQLLSLYQEPQPLTLTCEKCHATRRGRSHASITGTTRTLVLGIPRAGEIDEQGRQRRHSCYVRCEQKVKVSAGSAFVLTALVEHLAEGENTNSGHFVTWARHGAGWKRCDDATVELFSTLPDVVSGNVILSFYSKETWSGDSGPWVREKLPAQARGFGWWADERHCAVF